MKVKVYIYSHETVEEFDNMEEAKDRAEYLQRVQDKICKIYLWEE
jgi:hypothetical protein